MQFPQYRQEGEKKQDKADNLFSLKQPSHLNYNADREDRSSDHRDNVGYWWAGRGLSKCTRTTPLQITAAIYFYTANEAVRDGLHCQADLWIPMRGPIVSRWPWSFKALNKSTVCTFFITRSPNYSWTFTISWLYCTEWNFFLRLSCIISFHSLRSPLAGVEAAAILPGVQHKHNTQSQK